MGTSMSTIFPTRVAECTGLPVVDARFEYQCTSSSQVRRALTVIHLMVIVMVTVAAMLVYLIYLKVLDRKFQARLLALPGKMLPFSAGDVSRWMYRQVVAGYATVAMDDTVVAPPKGATVEGPKGWGAAGTAAEGVHYKDAILGVAGDLQLLACETLERLQPAAPPVPWAGAPLTLHSLRSHAPALAAAGALAPGSLWAVITTIERAEHLEYEFTADEFALFRQQAWAIMSKLRAAAAAAAATAAIAAGAAPAAPAPPGGGRANSSVPLPLPLSLAAPVVRPVALGSPLSGSGSITDGSGSVRPRGASVASSSRDDTVAAPSANSYAMSPATRAAGSSAAAIGLASLSPVMPESPVAALSAGSSATSPLGRY